MHFTARVFTLAKDPQHPDEFQDAWRMDPTAGVAAVADGVSSAIFSGQWAEQLVAAAVAGIPDPDDRPAFAQWLHSRRKEWSEAIDVGGLAWFQKAKLPLGAFSTLLWLRLTAGEETREETGTGSKHGDVPVPVSPSHRLQAFAIGDTCLLHVRDGRVLKTFPVQHSPEFEADPLVLGSVDLKRDHLLKFARLDEPCYDGDLLVLCTDAVAEWGLRQSESGSTPDWASCWDLTAAEWCEQIEAIRQQGDMRYDDATLMLLRVGGEEDALGRQLHCRPEEAANGSGSTTATPAVQSATATATAPSIAASTAADCAAPQSTSSLPSTSSIPGLTAGAGRKEGAPPADEPAVAPELVDEPQAEPNATAPILVEQTDWKAKFKSLSEQVSKGIDQVSGQVLRGVKTVADKAAEVYRDQFGPKKKK